MDFYARTSRPRNPSPNFSQTLTDIVKMCTFAHRQRDKNHNGYGDFVWLSWRGKKGSKEHPSNGCTLFACTRDGAAQIADAMQFRVGWPALLDLWFKDMAKHGLLQGSYIYPGLGDCATHVTESESTTSTWEREGHWNKSYVSQTTRVEKRWFSVFMPNGEQKPQWIGHIVPEDLQNDSLVWLSWKAQGVQVDDEGRLTGLRPVYGPESAGPPLTKRAKRKCRSHLHVQNHRTLTDDWLEAMLACTMSITLFASFVSLDIRVLCSGRQHPLRQGQVRASGC